MSVNEGYLIFYGMMLVLVAFLLFLALVNNRKPRSSRR